MSRSKTISEALNKAFAELSIVRHQTKQGVKLTKTDYNRVKECFMVLGKIRGEYLDAA